MHIIRIFQSTTRYVTHMVSFTLEHKYPTIIMPNMFIYCANKCPGNSYYHLRKVLNGFAMVFRDNNFVLIKIKIISADLK